MKTMFALLQQRRLRILGMAAALSSAGLLSAQTATPRILTEVSSSQRMALKGSQHPMALAQFDAGRMPGNAQLHGMSIYFKRSAAQEADLQALLAAQQNPASPQYHQWLTPDQFAARFGMAQADIDKVQSWLQQQGFAIDSVSRSKNALRFSGTSAQVEQAFNTQMHYYNVAGVKHFAPSTQLSLPAAFSGVVMGVGNLNDFRPRPQHVVRRQFTSGQSGNVFFAPGDILTAYDVNPLISGGYTGMGQTIAVMGQSAIQLSDIEAFQSAAGLTKKDPTLVIVPGSGTSTSFQGDESESDLDVEWSGAIAPGANIDFVYVGDSANYGVYDSLYFAIDEDLAPILSLSYSTCEPLLTQTDVNSMEGVLAQAAAQGQTILAASGDSGATACFYTATPGPNDLPLSTQEQLAVNYPASSAYVLAMGGTEIPTADGVDPSTGAQGANYSTYWSTNGSNDLTNSVKQYIPEVAWNDDAANCATVKDCLSSSGGGVSVRVTQPKWQTGVPGITSGGRLVPDISLYSSPGLPGYLYCTSDTSAWVTASSSGPAQQGSCSSGFRDASTGYLTVAGGTSFATPIFAGMVAILNQSLGYTTGQGLINGNLYSLAANSSIYASAFHDVTSGDNDCKAGPTYCANTNGFTAGPGYDEVTGLGSVDLANLAAAWPVNTNPSATLIGSTTTVAVSNSAPAAGTSVTFTVTVVANTGSGTPTGTVNFSIDGSGTAYGASGSSVTPVMLASNGTATYPITFSTSGPHEVVVQYTGDSTYAGSSGSAIVTVPITSTGKGTFALAATPATLTVSQGSTGTETVAATPASGYTGSVGLSLDFGTSGDNALQNLCGGFGTSYTAQGTIAVSGTAAASTTLTLDTNAADCATTAAVQRTGLHPLKVMMKGRTTARNESSPKGSVPAGMALAGLVLMGCLGRRSRKLRNLAAVLVVVAAGLALSACSSTVTTSYSNPPKGTYTGTITGTDSTTSSITGSTTFTFVIN